MFHKIVLLPEVETQTQQLPARLENQVPSTCLLPHNRYLAPRPGISNPKPPSEGISPSQVGLKN
jgi:hypothetical protein